MSITDIVACQLVKGMPELMKYNVEKDYKTTPNPFWTKLQILNKLELKLQKMKKEETECDSQIEQLKMDMEHLNTPKSTILKDKTNLSNIVRNSTSMKTNTSQVEELPPVSDQPKPGDQPPAATH